MSILGVLGYEWNELWIGVTILSIILIVPFFFFTPDESIISTTNITSNLQNNFGFSLITLSYGLYGFGYVVFMSAASLMEAASCRPLLFHDSGRAAAGRLPTLVEYITGDGEAANIAKTSANTYQVDAYLGILFIL